MPAKSSLTWVVLGAFAAAAAPAGTARARHLYAPPDDTSSAEPPSGAPGPKAPPPAEGGAGEDGPGERSGPTDDGGPAGDGSGPGPTRAETGGVNSKFEARVAPQMDLPEPIETEQAGTNRLPLDEAIELALNNHPAIRNARHQTEAAKSRVGQAQADYFPQIDGWLQYLRGTENGSVTSITSIPGLARVAGSTPDGVGTFDSFNNYIAALVLRQLIWDFGRTKGNVDAQKAFTEMAKVNEELVKQTVTFGVMQAYFDVWAARANVELAQENEKTALAILELAVAAHRAGLKPESEPARARAAVASARVAIIRSEQQLEVARARVANAVGMPRGHYEPVGYARDLEAVKGENELLEVAVANRPELQIFGYQKSGMKHTFKSVRAQQFPRIDAIAGVNTRGQFLTGAGQDPFNEFNANVGVVVNVPIFQGLRVRKQKQEVNAQMSALDERQEMVRQAVLLEVRRALAAVKAADAAAEASQEGVDAALKAVEILEGRYPEGLTKLVELTDAQRAYIDARSQQVRATYDRFLARAALSIAIGQPSG